MTLTSSQTEKDQHRPQRCRSPPNRRRFADRPTQPVSARWKQRRRRSFAPIRDPVKIGLEKVELVELPCALAHDVYRWVQRH